MVLCMFRYVFNVNINLPDDLAFNTILDGRQVLIRCKSDEGAKIISFSPEEDSSWIADKANMAKMEVTSYNKEKEARVARGLRFYEKKGFFSGGVIDPIRYTIVEVIFKIPSTDSLENEEFSSGIKEWSSKLLFHFLSLYRLHFQGGLLYPISVKDSPVIEIMVSEQVENDGDWLKADFEHYTATFNWEDPFKMGYHKQDFSDDKIEHFGNQLLEGRRVELYNQLLLDANTQSKFFENHAMAVILIGTAFEVFLQEILIKHCEKTEIEMLPVGRGANNEKNYHDAIMTGNIREDLISKYVYILTGEELRGGKEYNDWYENAYSLRNEIVHKGKQDIGDKDAEKAFNASTNLMNLIRKLFSNC